MCPSQPTPPTPVRIIPGLQVSSSAHRPLTRAHHSGRCCRSSHEASSGGPWPPSFRVVFRRKDDRSRVAWAGNRSANTPVTSVTAHSHAAGVPIRRRRTSHRRIRHRMRGQQPRRLTPRLGLRRVSGSREHVSRGTHSSLAAVGAERPTIGVRAPSRPDSEVTMSTTWHRDPSRGENVSMYTRERRRELRAALFTANGEALVSLLTSEPWPGDAIQLIGDGLLAALAQEVTGARDLALDCVTELRERDWEGDAGIGHRADRPPGRRGDAHVEAFAGRPRPARRCP